MRQEDSAEAARRLPHLPRAAANDEREEGYQDAFDILCCNLRRLPRDVMERVAGRLNVNTSRVRLSSTRTRKVAMELLSLVDAD